MRAMASPRRLEIIHLLGQGPCDVSTLAGTVGISQPNASQHLAIMRAAGVVDVERIGREARYRLADPDVLVACDLMRAVLARRIARIARIAEAPTPARAPALSR